MSYIECAQCGHKALSVATRCPRCGHDLPPQRLRRPEPKRELPPLRPVLLLAGAVVAGVVIVLVARHGAGSNGAGSNGAGSNGAGSNGIGAHPAAVPRDTAMSTAPQPSLPQPAAAADSSRVAAPSAPTPVVSPPAGQAVRRYARTWVNVREGRGRDTPPVRVLNPGEAVRVDSLRRGWYRLLVDGRVQGYVHRSQLDAVPPPATP